MVFPDDKLDAIRKKDLYPMFLCRDLVSQAKMFNKLLELVLIEHGHRFGFVDMKSGEFSFVCNNCSRIFKSPFDHPEQDCPAIL